VRLREASGMRRTIRSVGQKSMKSIVPGLFLVLSITAPMVAQNSDVVAVVNGEAITAQRLETLWSSLTPEMATRYEQVGGKVALLDNYIRKRLLLQDAARNGFESVEAGKELPLAEESALFSRYVQEHFGAQLVTDDDVSTFYVKNPERFRHLDQSLVRQIFVSTEDKSVDDARAKLGSVMSELHHTRATTKDKRMLLEAFAAAAAKHSEDKNSAPAGGSMGWRERIRLEPKLADAAFSIEPGTMSGILQTEKGLHLLFVEARREAGLETLERAAPVIRRSLIARRAQDILKAAEKRTDELMKSGSVEIFAENIQQ
jgi:hypothetical protein